MTSGVKYRQIELLEKKLWNTAAGEGPVVDTKRREVDYNSGDVRLYIDLEQLSLGAQLKLFIIGVVNNIDYRMPTLTPMVMAAPGPYVFDVERCPNYLRIEYEFVGPPGSSGVFGVTGIRE